MPGFRITDINAALERKTLNKDLSKALAYQRSRKPGLMRQWVEKMEHDLVRFRLKEARDRQYEAELGAWKRSQRSRRP